MPAAHVAYDPKTYSPGDPWTHPSFFTLAATAPRVIETKNAGEQSSPSYFENRVIRGARQQVLVGVSSGGALNVNLEQSLDGGDSWQVVKNYTANGVEMIDYPNFIMLRLNVVSGTGVTLTLFQGL